jgi:hypothetical protein
MSEFNFTQLPPDGTGKKMTAIGTVEFSFSYTGVSGYTFAVGDIITIANTSFNGNVIKIKDTEAPFEVYVVLNKYVDTATLGGANSEVQHDGETVATFITLKEDIHTQSVSMVGANNPLNGVSVDETGSMYMRFAGGSMSYDAFGKLQSSQSTTIREYLPVTNILPDDFEIKRWVAGALQPERGGEWGGVNDCFFGATNKLVTLQTGIVAGDKVSRRSHIYHKYQTGVATTVLFSCFFGDNGKTNVHRRIGLFDDDDGCFFHSDGDQDMDCVIRHSVDTGSAVNVSVPQAEWNVDRLDGSGGAFNVSSHTLDMSKIQVMFIDFQWLGGGRIRFGFNIDGVNLVCHEVYNANVISQVWCRTGSLPFSAEQENTGTPAPLGNSSMFLISASVKCEGAYTPRERAAAGVVPAGSPITDHVDWSHIASARSVKTIAGNGDNRRQALPIQLTIADTLKSDNLLLIEIVKDDVLTWSGAELWVDNNDSDSLEFTAPAVGVDSTTGGEIVFSGIVSKLSRFDLRSFFNAQGLIVTRDADINDDPSHYTIRGKLINSGAEVTPYVSLSWKEII